MPADQRIDKGLRSQFEVRRAALAGGLDAVGWKIGFNTLPAMQAAGIDAPVVGYLTSATQLAPGQPCDLSTATNPLLEPEIAIHVGPDRAIAALGAAIEIVDVDLPFDDLEAVLAANIFHRSLLLGEPDPGRAGGDAGGSRALVRLNGEQVAEAPAMPATDELVETVRHVAEMLSGHDEELEAGQVIIAGTLTPPVSVEPGDEVVVDYGTLGQLTLGFESS